MGVVCRGAGRVGVICKGDGGGQGRWRWGSLALYLSLSGRAQWGPPGAARRLPRIRWA